MSDIFDEYGMPTDESAVDIDDSFLGEYNKVVTGTTTAPPVSEPVVAAPVAEVPEASDVAGVAGVAGADVTEHVPDDVAAAPTGSLQHTDQQDDIQALAQADVGDVAAVSVTTGVSTVKTTSRRSAARAALPATPFATTLGDPVVRLFPVVILDALRAQLYETVVREHGVDGAEAEAFVKGLSQRSLVFGYVAAHLDIEAGCDPTTALVVALFQQRNPVLGTILRTVQELAERETTRAGELSRLQQTVKETQAISQRSEYGTSYLMANSIVNLGRGVGSVHEARIADADVIEMRDILRKQTALQQRLEREKEGRRLT